MKPRLMMMSVGLLVCTNAVFAADRRWTGTISDSKCGLSHQSMIAQHAGLTDRACTEACVKDGAKYVFASRGKLYSIENQTDPALAKHAGHSVILTGEMKGDTITASKITMRPAKRAAHKS